MLSKPCSECLIGVCETLPVALTFNLAELLDKCLKWSSRHFVRLWPSKQFAQLSAEVHDRCRSAVMQGIVSSDPSSTSVWPTAATCFFLLYIFLPNKKVNPFCHLNIFTHKSYLKTAYITITLFWFPTEHRQCPRNAGGMWPLGWQHTPCQVGGACGAADQWRDRCLCPPYQQQSCPSAAISHIHAVCLGR